MKKQTIITACTFAAMTMATPAVFAVQPAMSNHVCASDAIKKDNRPVESKRLFRSKAVEEQIQRIQQLLKNQKLSWMFTNCFPNTLDTTVHFRKDKKDGKPDTFVYTGDIHAMWLRDSGAQVWPYVQLANEDKELKTMLAGVINRQFKLINVDPFANAFNDGPIPDGHWKTDLTDMNDEMHERKWEIDSLCYPLRLAYHYWKTTGDTSIFDAEWIKAIQNILTTFRDQQRRDGRGSYHFQRVTERALDTMTNDGWGNPVKPVGLIASSFRPSDDATTFQFLIPSNFFAVSSLRKAAEILTEVNNRPELAKECTDLAGEVETALRKYATYNHPKYGTIYAFEVDGFGNHLLMDDANVPSLLAMSYLGYEPESQEVADNTRKLILSEANPFYYAGTKLSGIGSPHTPVRYVWHISKAIEGLTAPTKEEKHQMIHELMATDGGTGLMHEGVFVDDPTVYTREWFSWANAMFCELVMQYCGYEIKK